MVARSTLYYRSHPKAREKKKKYDSEFEKKPEQVKKRVELKRKNRQHDKKYGKKSREGKDLSHTSHGLVYKSRAANRGSKTDTAGDRRSRGGKKKKN